ncbi:sigma-E factor negative regulatory protein [Azoarcus olearius]|uniref:Sigma-E factor, negative regulatory protein n=1 Tax=Azoarcus sp. (strain BH72) TaxID=418699 RepID=A1K5Z3_AZOSB|nr:sigma-E factor negative regulatory protein [Azoarcus olearius]CAL94248.1 putative sigma-E factor, negative regulatory protein [Azoarcus olearius]
MKEKLSALLDGVLDEHAVAPTLNGLRSDSALRKEWDAYCLIGDVLRGDYHGAPDFVDKVMARVDAEPVVLAPRLAAARSPGGWRVALPLAASVMGVAAVGWVAANLHSARGDASAPLQMQRMASAPVGTAVPATVTRAPVSQGEAHREYVFAHQSMTAGGPIPGAVQYVRTVTETQQGAGQ